MWLSLLVWRNDNYVNEIQRRNKNKHCGNLPGFHEWSKLIKQNLMIGMLLCYFVVNIFFLNIWSFMLEQTVSTQIKLLLKEYCDQSLHYLSFSHVDSIGLDKSEYQVNSFLILDENICCGYSLEALLMSTHNICFRREIRKI